MPKSSAFVAASALSLFACAGANAALITSILPAPSSSLATSAFNNDPATNGSVKLYDGTAPTLSDIGTNRGTNDGGQWSVVNSSNGAEYIVYNLGSPASFGSVLYSQNSFGGTNPNWNWSSMTVWVSNTDPGTPNTDSGAGEAAADAARPGLVGSFTLLTGTAGQNLNQYDLTGNGTNLSGQYATFKFTPVGGTANPGGQDLWLGVVPEPTSTALLGGLGMLGLLRRRRQA